MRKRKPLIGRVIDLDHKRGALRPCQLCGGRTARIGEGRGPHLASINCRDCGRCIGWLGRAKAEQINGAPLSDGRFDNPRSTVSVTDPDSGERAWLDADELVDRQPKVESDIFGQSIERPKPRERKPRVDLQRPARKRGPREFNPHQREMTRA
jgi:hypothetical protein